MGRCYWHGGSSDSCPECKKEQDRTGRQILHHKRAKEMIPEHRYCSECESYCLKNKKHRCKYKGELKCIFQRIRLNQSSKY